MPQRYRLGAVGFAVVIAVIILAFIILLSRHGQNAPAPVQTPMHSQP